MKFDVLLPSISLRGAQTSNVSFPYPLITQWYTNSSGFVQVCLAAVSVQFFLTAALSHSFLDIGQNETLSTVSTASGQNAPLDSCCG